MVTSALAGEGKSTVSSNIARLVAQAGTPVLLIDADLRRPMIATTFEVDGAVGLTQALAGDVDVREVIIDSGMPNLSLLPAGRIPPNPSELLGSLRMKQFVDELSVDYLVILDAPPLLPVTDAGLLSAFCDGALLVQAAGKTQIEQSQQCRRILDQVGSRLLGVVLNKAPVKGAAGHRLRRRLRRLRGLRRLQGGVRLPRGVLHRGQGSAAQAGQSEAKAARRPSRRRSRRQSRRRSQDRGQAPRRRAQVLTPRVPTPPGQGQYAPRLASTAVTVRARISRSWTIDQLST